MSAETCFCLSLSSLCPCLFYLLVRKGEGRLCDQYWSVRACAPGQMYLHYICDVLNACMCMFFSSTRPRIMSMDRWPLKKRFVGHLPSYKEWINRAPCQVVIQIINLNRSDSIRIPWWFLIKQVSHTHTHIHTGSRALLRLSTAAWNVILNAIMSADESTWLTSQHDQVINYWSVHVILLCCCSYC